VHFNRNQAHENTRSRRWWWWSDADGSRPADALARRATHTPRCL